MKTPLVRTCGAMLLGFTLLATSCSTTPTGGRGLASDAKFNVNKADLDAIDDLPMVDTAMAKRIVDARPYKSDADLAKVVPADVLKKIKPMIVYDDSKLDWGTGRGLASDARFNVNKASLDAIDALPMVDAAMAKRIVDARPYKSDADLAMVVPADVLNRIKPMIVYDDSKLK